MNNHIVKDSSVVMENGVATSPADVNVCQKGGEAIPIRKAPMEVMEKDQECIDQERLKMTLVGQNVSPKESVNHGKKGAHLVSTLPLEPHVVDVSKKGNFICGEVEDLLSMSHDEED